MKDGKMKAGAEAPACSVVLLYDREIFRIYYGR